LDEGSTPYGKPAFIAANLQNYDHRKKGILVHET
jgi:hypothetical protein